jgi:hypothetical protein
MQAFWNWSWDELVTYDLPAVFDYVFIQTGQKINYVGHSLVLHYLLFYIKVTMTFRQNVLTMTIEL